MTKISTDTMPYIERDISWMNFNARVLQEAMMSDVPLLNRLSFLGIYSNNLDEFFRVRMASDSRVAELTGKGVRKEAMQSRALVNRLKEIDYKLATKFQESIESITEELAHAGVEFVDEKNLDQETAHFVRCYFRRKISGFLSPIWLNAIKDLYNDDDNAIYLAVKLSHSKMKPQYILMSLPVKITGRFILLPPEEGKQRVMYLDDMVRFCLPMLFPSMGYHTFEAYSFKFTKDAGMELDSDLHNGLLQKVAKAVKNRRKGPTMRVQYDATMPADLLQKLLRKLKTDRLDTLQASGRYHNHKDFMTFPDIERCKLTTPLPPALITPDMKEPKGLMQQVLMHDKLLHVPYESFDYFIRVLQEAALSPHVDSVKISLYRVARNSKVVEALICAARNGKKVTTMIELMARFDEQANINCAHRLQEAGVNVIFGVTGLKVHGKVVHIGLRTGRNIAVISTGNFHEGNAAHYTDCILFTAHKSITREVSTLFDFIQKPYSPHTFKELLVSPNQLRTSVYDLIDREINEVRKGKTAWIKIKINHITDSKMVAKLYEASQAGVQLHLLVRGCCSLIPGCPGYSENIEAYGIIDQWLEHSRILIFHAGGKKKTYIGSADWMPRNLDRRVEVMTPIYDEDIKKELEMIIDAGLRDNVKARVIDEEGNNKIHNTGSDTPYRSQIRLYDYYVSKAKKEAAS